MRAVPEQKRDTESRAASGSYLIPPSRQVIHSQPELILKPQHLSLSEVLINMLPRKSEQVPFCYNFSSVFPTVLLFASLRRPY